jgi:DNA-binding response OmpR family regulator
LRNGEGENHVRQEVVRRSEIVLVVDQDERVLQSLTTSLRKQGYRSLGAATYEEALEILELLLPDVVVSEVNFAAGPRGMDLFMWMRNNIRTAGIPFLFYAARIDREILIAGKRFGVEDFILKPSDDEVVTASIKNALVRRKSRS